MMNTKFLNLTNDHSTMVDEDIYELLSSNSEYSCYRDNKGYARCYVDGNWKSPKMLHRIIMNPPKDKVVDHINGNKLDNRRENLRICTQLENSDNRGSKNGYRGVSFWETTGKWRVQYQHNRKKIVRQWFTDEIAAANAWNYYAKIFGGGYAKLNDIPFMSKQQWGEYIHIPFDGKHSRYIGVTKTKERNGNVAWISSATVTKEKNKKKNVHIGYFKEEIDAAKSYDHFIIENGFIRKLNFNILDCMKITIKCNVNCETALKISTYLDVKGINYSFDFIEEQQDTSLIFSYDDKSIHKIINGFNADEIDRVIKELQSTSSIKGGK